MRKKRKTFRASAKFYIIVSVIAVSAIAGIVLWLHTDLITVKTGTIEFRDEVRAVVVRDEEVVAAESYGKADYLVPDLQRVEAETPIVDVYKWGYNSKVMDDLVDVRTKILQYEENNDAVHGTELTSVNERIADKTRQIREASQSETTEAPDAIVLEGELRELMNDRSRQLHESTASDQQLEEYRNQEQQLEERVSSWRDVWRAAEAGVVSYYFDGYEPVLNAETIRTASAAQVRQILDGTLPIAQISEGTEPLYRLVNNFEWYIIIPSTEPVLEFANDNTFTVVFSDYADRQFEGTIIGHIVEGADNLYVMEFSEDIGPLVNTRRVTATLSTTFTGLEVPNDAIVAQDGQDGVIVAEGKHRTFVPVIIRAQQGEETILTPLDAASLLTEGARVEL